MNKAILLFPFAAAVLLLICTFTDAQALPKRIPIYNKISNNSRNLFDIEKTFNRNWRTNYVKNEYYLKDAVKTIVFGWKLFEEWNWYCLHYVSPLIGEFQKINALEEFEKALNKLNKNTKTLSMESMSCYVPSSTIGGYVVLTGINCIAFDLSDAYTYLISSPSGGIWKATDNSSIWTILINNEPTLNVSDIECTVVNYQYSTANVSPVNKNLTKIEFIKDSGNSNIPKNYPFIDNDFPNRTNSLHKFKMINNDGNYMYSNVINGTIHPSYYALLQNHFNTFNATAKIEDKIPVRINRLLNEYNIPGNKVAA